MRKPHEILRLAIDSGAYRTQDYFMCHALEFKLLRGKLITAEEYEGAMAAVERLMARYNDDLDGPYRSLAGALGRQDLPNQPADTMAIYEAYINELSAAATEDQTHA